MKIVLIENEYEIPEKVLDLQKKNPLFSNIEYEVGCLSRSMSSIFPTIQECDGILCISTWMYTQQLEEYDKAFSSGVLKEGYSIFVFNLLGALETWEETKVNFIDYETFSKNVHVLCEKYNLYDVCRNEFTVTKVIYNKELNKYEHEQI